MPGQQVLVAGGKDGQRQPGHCAIDHFGHGAVATHGDQGPQMALGEEPIGLARDFIQIPKNYGLKTLVAEKFDQVRDAILGRPRPCLGVNRHDDVSEFR